MTQPNTWTISTYLPKIFKKNGDPDKNNKNIPDIRIKFGIELYKLLIMKIAQSAGAIEYTDCTSAEG